MSPAQLSHLSRLWTPRLHASNEAGLCAQTAAALRDLAFVYHLTQHIKAAIVHDQPDRSTD
jgi:hypothetical protein